MPVVIKKLKTRRGGIRLFAVFYLSALIVSSSVVLYAQSPAVNLLYFFSTTCGHCKSVEPVVDDLSKAYRLEGLVYGKGDPGPKPFPVRKGDKETSSRYGIAGVPTLVVLENGVVRQIIQGENDIRTSPGILHALNTGALSVSEMVAKGPQKTYHVTGWVVSRGDYFTDAKFFLTDRKTTVELKPWLPLEAVKAPFKTARPRLMSDVIAKPAFLTGDLIESGGVYRFNVKEEKTFDEK